MLATVDQFKQYKSATSLFASSAPKEADIHAAPAGLLVVATPGPAVAAA